jgi:hypothetical protein
LVPKSVKRKVSHRLSAERVRAATLVPADWAANVVRIDLPGLGIERFKRAVRFASEYKTATE